MNSINSETFTRSDRERTLRKEFPNLTRLQISTALNIITDSIIDAIALDEKVEIRGFGTFCLHTHKSRIARNPKTGVNIALERRTTVHFKPSKELKSRVNNI